MILGAQMVQTANAELLAFMRKGKYTAVEIKYQSAKHISDQKEGYKLIMISSAWVTGLMFEPTKVKNPRGPVPYLLSRDDRYAILGEIDRLFGKELKVEEQRVKDTKVHNAILAAVGMIRRNIASDNYPESE